MTGIRKHGIEQPQRRMGVSRVLLVLDIQGFSRPEHDDWIQLDMRARLYRALLRTIEQLPAGACGSERHEILDRGDGVIVLASPLTPAAAVITHLVEDLPCELEAVNGGGGPRIRVRVAVHRGTLLHDRYGPVGEAINRTWRMQESTLLHARLAGARADVVVMLSDAVFSEAVLSGATGLDPDEFDRGSEDVKGTVVGGWLRECRPRRAGRTAPRRDQGLAG